MSIFNTIEPFLAPHLQRRPVTDGMDDEHAGDDDEAAGADDYGADASP
jgi:hypothetical protein